MAFFRQAALFLGLVAAAAVSADVEVDCGRDAVRVRWREDRSRMDPSLFLLGDCRPTSISSGEAVFNVELSQCSFRRMVTGDKMMFLNDLTYKSLNYLTSKSAPNGLFSQAVDCAYERPEDWTPYIFSPVFYTFAHGDLVFHMGIMTEDFAGPARSSAFPLGSYIPIQASVEQGSHQPLLLLLDECMASTDPELQPDAQVYPIITNKGCLVDSKTTKSKFQPREETSEIRLSLQAFKFALGEEIYIHCKLVAWDPDGLDGTKKACHYVKGQGWELLDSSYSSSLCNCCDSICRSRNRRTLASGKRGVMQNVVLGPLTIIDSDPSTLIEDLY